MVVKGKSPENGKFLCIEEITDMKKNQIRKNIVKALAKKMPDEQKQPIEIKSEAIPLSKAEQIQ